jgi:SAM-dependent methyltransferase
MANAHNPATTIQSALICSPRDIARIAIDPSPSRDTAIQINFFHKLILPVMYRGVSFSPPQADIDSAAPLRYQPPLRLSQKLGKILTGEAFDSARRHTRAIVRNRRFPARITASAIIKSIDAPRFEEIRRKYAVDDPGDAPPKYLDLEHWIGINLQRVRELELDYAPRSRILDLGCGAGYFLYINKLLGHEILGLDLDDLPMFRELTELLQIPRTIARIEAFQPLPKFDRKFDLITAYLICFNNHKSDKLWGPAEWDYFLSDAASHLAPNGRLWLELNREYDGSYYTPELKEFFERRGAELQSYRVIFNPGSLVPGEAASVAR